jgi:chromosome segregation ATPase
MAALAQVPRVMAAGQGVPAGPNQVQVDGLVLIQGQQDRIRELEVRVLQGQVQGQQVAQGYEDQLFAMSQEKQMLANQLGVAQQQIANITLLFEQRQAEVQELQRRQVQDAAQIAASLRESAALNAQLVQERARVQLLTQQIAGLANRIEQQNAQIRQQNVQIQRQGAQIQETLAMLQRQQKAPESNIFADMGNWALQAFWSGIRFFPPSDYTPNDA